MKYFSLIWSALFRSKTRTLLTLLSVVAAFLLFGLLDSVRVAFNSGGSVAGADRLVNRGDPLLERGLAPQHAEPAAA